MYFNNIFMAKQVTQEGEDNGGFALCPMKRKSMMPWYHFD